MTRTALRGAMLVLQGLAFAVWLTPLAALAARAVFGLEGLGPWQNGLCALPLSTSVVWVCPLGPTSIAAHPPGALEPGEVVVALFMAWLAGLAYLRPLASMAWFLGVGWGVMGLLLHAAVLLIEPGRREGDPIPQWVGNSELLVLVLLAGALAIHIGRWLGRTQPGRG